MRVGPAQRPRHQTGVRVEQQLVRVEPIAALRRVRTVHPVPVELAGAGFGKIAMPDEVGALAYVDPRYLPPALGVEQAQLDGFRVFRIQREVDARAIPG